MPRFHRLALVGALGLSVAACSSSPSIHGSPPLSNAPAKIETFVKPYERAFNTLVGPGVYGTAMIVGPHFMPGACEGWVTGDRKLVCDLRERYIDDPKEAKPDANMRYRCIRTLGGGTECAEATP
ncbi:MAG: hypothetical protein ING19_20980 [Azospirillum sp.]|nr:hypothetical protein [Azospirillum sp.]MCZ8125211.1 hypothetical protein [Magnetospirillum sp.]